MNLLQMQLPQEMHTIFINNIWKSNCFYIAYK